MPLSATNAPSASASPFGTNGQRVDRAQVSSESPRLSVIIPARNEEHSIGQTLDHVRAEHLGEIIVVDGASRDRTSEIAQSYDATVISSRPGRGIQLRAGSDIASGELLLFLHADTLLPRGFRNCIVESLSDSGVVAGAFRLQIDAPGLSFRMIEKAVQFRSSSLQLPYGDQALFMKAETLQSVRGYRDWPIMEDFELVRRLRAVGRIVVAPRAVRTSARRWMEHGLWRTTATNLMCAGAYLLGVSPERIAHWRRTDQSCSRGIVRP